MAAALEQEVPGAASSLAELHEAAPPKIVAAAPSRLLAKPASPSPALVAAAGLAVAGMFALLLRRLKVRPGRGQKVLAAAATRRFLLPAQRSARGHAAHPCQRALKERWRAAPRGGGVALREKRACGKARSVTAQRYPVLDEEGDALPRCRLPGWPWPADTCH